MKKSFKVTPLVAALALTTTANAETLSPIIVKDDVAINPNVTEPEEYARTRGAPADGGEFLRQVNGVNMSRFGGRGLEPIIRGQSQTRLNIKLDGAYVHGGCPNRMDPPASWAALETYEKVEVIRGVQTLIHGGGGSGGTVLFERDTRALAEEKGVHGRVTAAASTNGMKYDFLADVVASGEKGYVRFFTEVKENDNYEDGDGRTVRSAFDHKQGGIVLGYTPTAHRLLELTIEHNKFTDALYPGAGMDSPLEEGTFYRLRYEDKPALSWLDEVKAEVYRSDVDHVMNNFSLRPFNPAMKRQTDTTSNTTGGRVILTSSIDNTVIKYGIDAQQIDRDATLFNMSAIPRIPMFNMWPGVTNRQIGIFVEATTRFDDKRRLTYGIRVDRTKASADKANIQVMAAMPPSRPNTAYALYYGTTAVKIEETNVGGLLRYEMDIADDLTFFAGISRSVRTADATERFMAKWGMPGTRWVGNPALKPEKHHQLDIGLSKTTDRYSVSGSLFYNDVSDYILRDTARGQAGILQTDMSSIYRNVDARLWGAEIEGSIRLNKKVDLTGAISYVNATNTTDSRPIAQTPPLSGKIQIDYRGGRWNLGGRVRFAASQGRIDVITIPTLEVGKTSGWAVIDLYGSYAINDTFTLRYGIDNLLDKTYAEHASRANPFDPIALKVNEPGRAAWLKLTAEF